MFTMDKIKNARSALEDLSKEEASMIIIEYISSHKLELEYIDKITELVKIYSNRATDFIIQTKRDINALFVDSQFGHDVFKNIDINENNWFWYARLLRDAEDEVFPKRNYLQPTYLLGRLKPIIANLDVKKIKNYSDLYELYGVCLSLMDKYGVENCKAEKE